MATKCHLNHAAFDSKTEERDYWAGFLFADGGIYQPRQGSPALTLKLQGKDREHVEKFRKFLGSTHKVVKVRQGPSDAYQLQVRSKPIVEMLRELGMNGLHSTPTPELSMSKDFWRGVVDGDGCLGKYTDNRHYTYSHLSLVGGEVLVERFKDYIRTLVPQYNANPYHRGKICQLNIAGKGAETLMRELYLENQVSLDRKNELAMRILKVYEE